MTETVFQQEFSQRRAHARFKQIHRQTIIYVVGILLKSGILHHKLQREATHA